MLKEINDAKILKYWKSKYQLLLPLSWQNLGEIDKS